jgi:hypothetical protein
VISNGVAIFPDLAVGSFGRRSIQLKLARNYYPREIALADKIRDYENLANRSIREKKSRVAQARFFFPKSAPDVDKDVSLLYL